MSAVEKEALATIIRTQVEEYTKRNSTLIVAEEPGRKFYPITILQVAQTFEQQAEEIGIKQKLKCGAVIGMALELMRAHEPNYHELAFLSGRVSLEMGMQAGTYIYENKDATAAIRGLFKEMSLRYTDGAARSFRVARSLIKPEGYPLMGAYITKIDEHRASAMLVKANSKLKFMDDRRTINANREEVCKRAAESSGDLPDDQETLEDWIIKQVGDGQVREIFIAAQSAARLYRTMLSTQPFMDTQDAAQTLANYVRALLFFPNPREEAKLVTYINAAESILGRNSALDDARQVLSEARTKRQWRKRDLQ